jgi:hypothetical protein
MVISEDFANLAVLSIKEGVTSPRKSDFVPRRRGSNTSNRTKMPMQLFLAKLSNKEIYLKMALSLSLIKSNCPIEDVLIPLNCKVSAGDIRFLQGKYKTTPIFKNVG